MPRKVELLAIEAEGRDHGKVFKLSEMPAYQGERWACRALLALGKRMPEMPDDLAQLGWMGIVQFGLHSFLSMDYEEATKLLDEMMTCVQFVPDASRPGTVSPLPIFEDIEEVATILKLREEVFKLHTGFSIAASLSNLGQAAVMMLHSAITATSPEPSAQPSPAD